MASLLVFGVGIILCQFALCSKSDVIIVTSNCTPSSVGDHVVDNSSCIAIDEAMEAWTSDSDISIEQGTHVMARPHNVSHLQNISLTGTSETGVYITCDEDIGLSFINISGLTLANLTIQGCGLYGETLQNAVSSLGEILRLWFIITPSIRVALFLGHCEDLVMTNMNVNGTRGLGMLAINVIGDSVISFTNFTWNTRQSCLPGDPVYPFNVNTEVLSQTGGGAYFLYHDYLNESLFHSKNHSLLISDSFFAHNSDCSYSTLTHINNRYIEDGVNRFTIGAGGGLSVLYAHSMYSISVRVEFSTFYGNDARYGAGAYVGSFLNFLYPNSIVFSNCSFIENGLASIGHYDTNSLAYCHSGAGLAIFTDLFKPSNLYKSIENVQNISVSIIDTMFVGNEAKIEGGGVFAFSLVNSPHRINSLLHEDYFSIEWKLENCVLRYNRARLNAAASFVQRILHSVDGNVVLYLNSITVHGNGPSVTFASTETDDDISSTIAINNVFTQFKGISHFTENYATALHIVSAYVFMTNEAELVFERNLGQRGGAIFIEGESPGFFVSTNVTVIFRENMALVEGGAVYFGDPIYPTSYLQPLDNFGCSVGTIPLSNLDLFSSGSRFEFHNNFAPIGSVFFGGTIRVCPWTNNITMEDENLLLTLYRNYNSTFLFDEAPVGVGQVSTIAASISVSIQEEIFPGEVVDLEINVFDRFDNKIFAVVSSEVMEYPEIYSKLRGSRYFYTGSGTPTLRLTGAQNQTIEVSFFTFINIVRTTVTINLLSCPVGFEFHDGACDCSPKIFSAQHSHHSFEADSNVVTCDDESVLVTTESDYWIGTESHLTDSTDSSNLIVHECHADYCRENVSFRPPDYDSQCGNDSHRTGVLCGACLTSDGYSVVFGSTECKKCSNFYLLLIPLFAVLGVLLFLVIAFLEFTIDKGWLNAVLFYCNLMSIYSFSFSAESIVHFLLIPAHFLSLEVGFSLCLFDGMTALTRTAVQFAFPVYLHLLLLIFRILAQRYSLSCYFSPVKTFVTIMIMCFVSLLNTCVEILAAHEVVTAGGVRSIRWLVDPNLLYFRGWHALLGIIAIILLLVYLIPLTLSASFPSFVYKVTKSAKPFFDAVYAPYKDQYRFWIGIRLITRALLVIASKFFPISVSLLINLIILLTILHVQTSIQPYKSKWLGIVDSYLIINAAILYIGNLVKTSHIPQFVAGDLVYVCFFLSIAYLVIAVIFGYHVDMRFPVIREKLAEITERVRPLIRRRDKSMEEIRMAQLPSSSPHSTSTLTSLPDEQPIELQCRRMQKNKSRSTSVSANYRDSILDTIP